MSGIIPIPYQVGGIAVEPGTMNSPPIPAVHMTVQGHTTVLTPHLARQLAMHLNEAARATESKP